MKRLFLISLILLFVLSYREQETVIDNNTVIATIFLNYKKPNEQFQGYEILEIENKFFVRNYYKKKNGYEYYDDVEIKFNFISD